MVTKTVWVRVRIYIAYSSSHNVGNLLFLSFGMPFVHFLGEVFAEKSSNLYRKNCSVKKTWKFEEAKWSELSK